MRLFKRQMLTAIALLLLFAVAAEALPTTTLINNFKIVAGSLLFQNTRSPYGNIMTITPAVPTGNRTYTIPDTGTSTANFLMSAGTQSLAGPLTITGGLTLPAGSVTGSNLAANTVESGQLGIDVIQHATIPVTSANLLAMYATPVQLIAAGGTNTNIVVHKVMFTMTSTATQYAGGGVLEFQIGNTVHGAGTATTATVAAAVVNATAGTSYSTVIPVSYTGTSATGLFISNQTAAFTTGTGTAVVDIWYSIQ